jgi:hypothetical protein
VTGGIGDCQDGQDASVLVRRKAGDSLRNATPRSRSGVGPPRLRSGCIEGAESQRELTGSGGQLGRVSHPIDPAGVGRDCGLDHAPHQEHPEMIERIGARIVDLRENFAGLTVVAHFGRDFGDADHATVATTGVGGELDGSLENPESGTRSEIVTPGQGVFELRRYIFIRTTDRSSLVPSLAHRRMVYDSG